MAEAPIQSEFLTTLDEQLRSTSNSAGISLLQRLNDLLTQQSSVGTLLIAGGADGGGSVELNAMQELVLEGMLTLSATPTSALLPSP